MAYSAEESSPIAYITESCCICDEEFSSDSDLTNHLIDHANDEEFKTGLLELEKKSPTKNSNPTLSSTPTAPKTVSEKAPPLKRTASQRSGSPEVWEIISDDSDDESSKNKKSAKLSNSFRLVSTPTKTPENTPVANGQTYKCHVCTSVFNDPNVLKEHLLAHEKDKQYVCHICKKQFLHKGTLRQHLHLHIGDKSHQCKVCNKKFSLKSVLRKHEETHIQQAAPQPRRSSTQTRRQKSV